MVKYMSSPPLTIEELYHGIQKLETENRELGEINNKLKDGKILLKQN